MFDSGRFPHDAGLARRHDFGPLPHDALDAGLGHDGATQSFNARLLAGTLRLVLLERNKIGLTISLWRRAKARGINFYRAAKGQMAIKE